MTLPADTVELVRGRANCACEYCGVSEAGAGGRLTIDHYRPQSRGGSDDVENLVYCCYRCNLFKADYWPESANDLDLWNPRRDPRSAHLFELADGQLLPVTAVGAFTLRHLRLNRPELVERRIIWRTRSELRRLFERHEEMARVLDEMRRQLAVLARDQHELLAVQQTILQHLLRREE
jgi:hypothetical protein